MPRNSAFTLLELLLTLSMLAVVFAVVVPQFTMMLGDRRLMRAANVLQIELTELRVEAMREGRVMMLDAEIGSSTIRIRPFNSLSDSIEALDQTGSQSTLLSGATQGSSVPIVSSSSSEERLIELPEGISVENVAVVASARGLMIAQSTASSQASAYSQPILFYPDGTSSNASVTLLHNTVGRIVVKLRGIIGEPSFGDMEGL